MGDCERVGVREWRAFTYLVHKIDRTGSVGASFAVRHYPDLPRGRTS